MNRYQKQGSLKLHAKQDTASAESFSTQFSAGRKITQIQKMQMYIILQDDPDCPTRALLEMVTQIEGPVGLTVRHVNRLRLQWGLSRNKGRPCKKEPAKGANQNKELIVIKPNISFAGLHVFDDWMEEQEGFCEIIQLLEKSIDQYENEHPNDSFPLLSHKTDTLGCRLKALLYAPLFGIGKLTEYDVKDHALKTVIGRGYQSSTMNQFLGQLERINAGDCLMPALISEQKGTMCYIDGHMIEFWTKASMHKGKITMLGRIMAGSNAVVSHNEKGEALFVEYYPPDFRLPNVIMDYCESVSELTGMSLFVIDREINSLDVASAFESRGWGLISMLDKNQYGDLSDWDAECIASSLDDGSKIYSGPWKNPDGDDRHFVIVEKKDRLLPYWGTSHVKKMADPAQWPAIYSQRTEVQENNFKRMIEHGALNVNFGIKKVESEDRHQQRKMKKLETASVSIGKKINKKKDNIELQVKKVKESKDKGHGQRLLQREKSLEKMEGEMKELSKKAESIEEKKIAIGPCKKRFDRDFRKQKIMTFRTLFLENCLIAFLSALMQQLDIRISLKCLLELFFKRKGGYIETFSEIVYWLNTDGLSKNNQTILQKIADGLCKMEMERNGKPIRVQLRALSP
jgi:hypothetical protein